MSWATHKSGLILPNREILAYSDADYERWINKRRAPFQVPFVRLPFYAGSSLVGTPFHQEPATSTTGYSTGITTLANDIVVVAVNNDGATSAVTISGGTTATMASQIADSHGAGPTKCSIWTGLVTVGGSLTVAVTNPNALIAFTVSVYRGLSSATASATMSALGVNNTSPCSGTLDTTGKGTCTFVVAHANFTADVFTSWLGSPTITAINHSTTQSDANGYSLDVVAGSYTVGNNQTISGSSDTESLTLAIALPVATAGTRPVKMAGEWAGYAGTSGGFAG